MAPFAGEKTLNKSFSTNFFQFNERKIECPSFITAKKSNQQNEMNLQKPADKFFKANVS